MSDENIAPDGEAVGDDGLDGRQEQNEAQANQDDLESSYQFYRKLVKRNIFQMTDITEQRLLSSWLHKCDEEQDKSLSNGYTTLMLVSFHNSGGHFRLFKESAPPKLPQLTNTAPFLYKMVGDQLLYDSIDDYDEGKECPNSIHAVVSSDMTSYATKHVTEYIAQVFYARSDNTMDTWILPGHVQFPVYSRSPPDWERAMSTTPRTVHVIPAIIQETDQKDEDDESEKTPAEIKCRGMMGEQVSMGEHLKQEFQWYDKSRLDGSLRPINEVCIDKNTCRHEKNQLELDERAINMLNRIYPGCLQIVISPRLIAEVTGIHVDQKSTDHYDLHSHIDTLKIDPNACDNLSEEVEAPEEPEEPANDRECPAERDASQRPPRDVQKCREYEDDLTRDASESCHQPAKEPVKSGGPVSTQSAKCGCETIGSKDEKSADAQPKCSLHGKTCPDTKTAKWSGQSVRFSEDGCNHPSGA